MKKLSIWKRLFTLACVGTMVLSLAGCGSDETAKNPSGSTKESQEEDEYVYVPEIITLELEEGTYLGDAQILGEELIYDSYEWNEETGEGYSILCRHNMNTGEVTRMSMSLETEENMDAYMNRYVVDGDGNIYAVWNVSPVWEEGKDYDYTDVKYYLVKYDSQGQQIYMQDISESMLGDEENSYIQYMIIGKDGKVYASADSLVRIYGEDGSFLGQVESDGRWIMGLTESRDGRVFLSQYSNSGSGVDLIEILADSMSLGETYTGLPDDSSGSLKAGVNEDILVCGGTNLYAYDLEDQSCKEVLSWAGCNIVGSNIRSFAAMEDGTYLAVCEDYSTDTDITEVVRLSRKLRSEVPEKIRLVLGSFSGENSDLQRAVVDFNKKSTEYTIEIDNYSIDYQEGWTSEDYNNAVAQFNASLVGDNAPDIIDLSYNIDVASLLAKNALEDLTPYLESSEKLSREDFVEGILNAYTIDGKLITIPDTVSIETLLGRTEMVGEEPGWTVQEIIDFANANPDADLLDYTTKEQMLEVVMTYSFDTFVDAETGSCSFNSQEFKDVLEFANAFPDEYVYDENMPSMPSRVQSGQLLLVNAGMYDMQQYQMYCQMFGTEVTNIGFPTFDGSQGTYIQGQEAYAIFANSENKEGAWQFIESILQYEKPDRWGMDGFSSRKDVLEEAFENDMTPEYILDENGEQVLDENGEPMQNPKTSWGYDDWDTEIYAATQEQVDEVKDMLANAKSVLLMDDTLFDLIAEEAQSYFSGQKTVDEVADIIQSRAQIYVSENY